MNKAKIWIGAIFTPIGLFMAGFALWSFFDSRSLAEIGASTGGRVIELARSRDSDGDVTYRPVVEFFDAQGTRHEFTGSFGTNPSRYHVGEAVTVLYDPQAPGRAMVDGFFERYFLPLLLGGLGSLFGAIGIGFLASYFRRKKVVARLKARGLPIRAKFLETYVDRSTKVNGRSPFRVVCQTTHPATGKLHRFESDPVWIDPTEEIGGRELRVLVDPTDARHHYVDLDEWLSEEMRS